MEAVEIDFLEAASVPMKTAISVISGLSSVMGMWFKLIPGNYFLVSRNLADKSPFISFLMGWRQKS